MPHRILLKSRPAIPIDKGCGWGSLSTFMWPINWLEWLGTRDQRWIHPMFYIDIYTPLTATGLYFRARFICSVSRGQRLFQGSWGYDCNMVSRICMIVLLCNLWNIRTELNWEVLFSFPSFSEYLKGGKMIKVPVYDVYHVKKNIHTRQPLFLRLSDV